MEKEKENVRPMGKVSNWIENTLVERLLIGNIPPGFVERKELPSLRFVIINGEY